MLLTYSFIDPNGKPIKGTEYVAGGEIAVSQKHLSNVVFAGLILRMKVTRLDGTVLTLESEDGVQFTCYVAEEAMPSGGLNVGVRIQATGSSLGTGAMIASTSGSVKVLDKRPIVKILHWVKVKEGRMWYNRNQYVPATVPDGMYRRLYLVIDLNTGRDVLTQ